MKKAFTLIEVMISTVIFFLAFITVMEIVQNNRHLISLINKNNEFTLKASVAFLHTNGKTNYERLKDFNITNDKIIYYLKKDKIIVDKIKDSSQEFKIDSFKIKEIIYKLKAYNEHHGVIVYSIGIK